MTDVNLNKKISSSVEAHLSPQIVAEINGLIGRGVKDVSINDTGELLFIMTDGRIINLGVISGGGSYTLPTATTDKLGGIKVGKNLKISDGILSVDTASKVESDNTKPVTSGAVYMEIGNIEVLLKNI